MQVLCLYGLRKSKPRLKSELCKQQYTVTLFYFNHWAQVIVCYWTVFALFYFEFEGNFRVQTPRGVYLEGRFIGGFFRYEFGGGGLYLKGLIFRILRYMAVINLPTNVALTMLNYCWRRLLHACIHHSLTRSDQKHDMGPLRRKNYLQLCITM